MAWQDCVAEIRAAAGDGANLSDRDIEAMLEAIMRRVRRKAAVAGDPHLFDRDALNLASRELANETRLAAAIEQRNARLNMLARIGLRERIGAAPESQPGRHDN